MQLTSMKFAVIEGTEVKVAVRNAAEARAAIKELKLKRRELGLQKRVLSGKLKAATKKAAPPRKSAKPSRSLTGSVLKGLGGVVVSVANVVAGAETPADTAKSLTRQLGDVEATVHNIDSCLIQLQGRLLALE